jgi:hypothetical protein
MDEFTIGFVDEAAVWRELSFRGVSENVAKALANGLASGGFDLVTLTGAQPTVIDLTENPSSGATGSTGATGP